SERAAELDSRILSALVGLSDPSDLGQANASALDAVKEPRDPQRRRQLAAALLRLIAEPKASWLTEAPWRPVLASLFDDVVIPMLHNAQIDRGMQAHEKLAGLKVLVRTVETGFGRALDELTSLSRLNSHRQKLLKALNDKEAQLVMGPFLPQNISA